jgi:hypothetical protein
VADETLHGRQLDAPVNQYEEQVLVELRGVSARLDRIERALEGGAAPAAVEDSGDAPPPPRFTTRGVTSGSDSES